jgi:hypothetical protein
VTESAEAMEWNKLTDALEALSELSAPVGVLRRVRMAAQLEVERLRPDGTVYTSASTVSVDRTIEAPPPGDVQEG